MEKKVAQLIQIYVISYSTTHIVLKYLSYYAKALNGKGHGIHSPFVYDFTTNVLNDNRNFYAYKTIEALRRKLFADHRVIQVEDFGAGSASMSRERTIASIARTAAKQPKLAQLLFRIVNHYQYENILELGTSLGISTAYLASANSNSSVLTCEGSVVVAEAASKNFDSLGLFNIRQVTATFDDFLPRLISAVENSFDLVFVDGNHQYNATLHYFQLLKNHVSPRGMLIFDDIHWSKEMELAWGKIKADSSVRCSIDLFFFGIVLFNSDFKVKQHYTIRY